MTDAGRRDFLRNSTLGLAAAGVGALTLRATAEPTAASGDAGEFGKYVIGNGEQPVLEIPDAKAPEKLEPTEDNILGPYFRRGAPFRAKITPPMEQGEVLVVRGRVWGHETKKPLSGAVLHIWQANAKGRYDNDDSKNAPRKGVFHNRARLRVDETGYYEYETIKPGRYKIGEKRWRPAHIHYAITAPGHKTLVTQLYFKGDPENDRDDFIKDSLIIDPEEIAAGHAKFMLGTFDIVLQEA